MTAHRASTRDGHSLLFLALLIPAIAGQLALAQDQPGADYALIIDVYSGEPAGMEENGFWLWLESLKKGEEAGGAWLPKVIHIEHALSEKDFDIAEQGDANGHKVVVKGHVSRQVDDKFKIVQVCR